MTVTPTATRRVWFHRQYEHLTGGHVKHSHYYAHVARLPGFSRRITFSTTPANPRLDGERAELWPTEPGERVDAWQPEHRDVLFLAGTDWRYHAAAGLADLDLPRINLIQHIRHAHAGTELYGFLDRRAVRICVSEEVADAIRATGRVNGPVFTIPNGTDCTPSGNGCGSAGFDDRPEGITIVGYKRRDLATALSRRLSEQGVPHLTVDNFLDRDDFLALLGRTQVAVCLPRAEEGFYLPALEAMAAGCTVVTLDCVGNRGFCVHDRNCLVAEADPAALACAVAAAADLSVEDRQRMHRSAEDTVRAHSLDAERQRFHDLMRDLDRLWSSTPGPHTSTVRQADAARQTPRRAVDFMIVGTQKSGTTALSHFLSQHPEIAMAPREGHVFDSPDYSRDWTPEEIDSRYSRRFERASGETVCGESTPNYLFLPDIPVELRRYNPDLKVIALLRDPVERALSHYTMERSRGKEHRPLWLALLAEPLRLRRCPDPRGLESAARRHSYRSRGLYSVQLRNVFRAFSRDQVLVVESDDLLQRHDEVLEKVFAFLGVSVSVRVPHEIVFKGEDIGGKHVLVRSLLRISYLAESRRLRALSAKTEART